MIARAGYPSKSALIFHTWGWTPISPGLSYGTVSGRSFSRNSTFPYSPFHVISVFLKCSSQMPCQVLWSPLTMAPVFPLDAAQLVVV